ncbi:MAG TPA: diguanylate cyclase [Thermotogota bacterium]|nr:diguanylate cyclase [Thermotogota bacterium]HOF23229.1 diguanylate cyclase [Thermotogota bacterium]HOM54438.1 diguanylate cyclase [Thermotogota bacterium]HOS24447.1 diguanylate cyclase [Thermotogota bacterium]HOT85829.1 diguanylate cyclase [Thermotogota bacterium]
MRVLIRKYYFFFIALLATLVAGLLFQYLSFERLLREESMSVTALTAETIEKAVSGKLRQRAQVILDAGVFTAGSAWTEESLLDFYIGLMNKNPTFMSIYYGSTDNVMINGSGYIPPPTFDLRRRPWYVKAVTENRLIFTEAFINATKDQWVITIACPVYGPDGKLMGVVAGDVIIGTILELIFDQENVKGTYSFLIDGKNYILAHPFIDYDLTRPLKNVDELALKLLETWSHNGRSLYTAILDGKKGFLTYQGIEGTDWQIVTFFSYHDYLSYETQVLTIFTISGLASVIVFLLFLWLSKKYIWNPVLRLESEIAAIDLERSKDYRLPAGKGAAFTRVRQTINHVLERAKDYFVELENHAEELAAANEQLEASFNQLALTEEEVRSKFELLKHKDERLARSEKKFKSLITEMQQALVLLEIVRDENGIMTDTVFLDINRAFEQLFQTNRSHVIGQRATKIAPDFVASWLLQVGRECLAGGSAQYEQYFPEMGRYFDFYSFSPEKEQFALLITDISARKADERALLESEETFRALFEESSDPVVIVQGPVFVDCNHSAVAFLGEEQKEAVIGKTIWDFSPAIQPNDRPSIEAGDEVLKLAVAEGKAVFDWEFTRKDGAPLYVEVMLTPITLRGESMYHCLWRDISQRRANEQRLEYLSYHDHLTGIYNRRFFMEELKRLDVRRNLPITLIMADVNGLKLVNDSFGHSTGDRLLQKISTLLKKACRADDILARIGGDEFAALLPQTNAEETERIIHRMQELLSTEKINDLDLSVSFGYQSKVASEEDLLEILRKAEEVMLTEKLNESPLMKNRSVNVILGALYRNFEGEERHSKRVSNISRLIGSKLGLSEDDLEDLEKAALLHDIGKIAIDKNIWEKNGPLTEEERAETRRHPEIGFRILATTPSLAKFSEWVWHHHEWWDGSGYPKGLKGDQIPLKARVISVAEAYDRMTGSYAYRQSLTKEEAKREILRCAGTQFDPAIVARLLEIIDEERFV